MVCRGCDGVLCSYSSPRLGGGSCCHLLLRSIATAALLSPFLVHALWLEELPHWISVILAVLHPPLTLALILSTTFLLIQLTHLVLPRIPPLLHLLLLIAVSIALGLSFAIARWLLLATLLFLVDGAFVAILQRCVGAR